MYETAETVIVYAIVLVSQNALASHEQHTKKFQIMVYINLEPTVYSLCILEGLH